MNEGGMYSHNGANSKRPSQLLSAIRRLYPGVRFHSTGSRSGVSLTLILEAPPAEVVVFGRSIRVPWTANGVCEFTFSQLCEEVCSRFVHPVLMCAH